MFCSLIYKLQSKRLHFSQMVKIGSNSFGITLHLKIMGDAPLRLSELLEVQHETATLYSDAIQINECLLSIKGGDLF